MSSGVGEVPRVSCFAPDAQAAGPIEAVNKPRIAPHRTPGFTSRGVCVYDLAAPLPVSGNMNPPMASSTEVALKIFRPMAKLPYWSAR